MVQLALENQEQGSALAQAVAVRSTQARLRPARRDFLE